MKILYPELVYGAIASSGMCGLDRAVSLFDIKTPLIAVTHATIENWEYMEIIRQAADPKCSAHLENSIKTIDAILLRGNDPVNMALKRRLKGLFGVADLEHDEDFASLIEVRPLNWLSSHNI